VTSTSTLEGRNPKSIPKSNHVSCRAKVSHLLGQLVTVREKERRTLRSGGRPGEVFLWVGFQLLSKPPRNASEIRRPRNAIQPVDFPCRCRYGRIASAACLRSIDPKVRGSLELIASRRRRHRKLRGSNAEPLMHMERCKATREFYATTVVNDYQEQRTKSKTR
jgi:hypothetical protein